MRNDPFPITSRTTLKRLLDSGAAEKTKDLAPHVIIRAIRYALRMTQAQLAKRAGMPQSHLAKIETGRVDIQLSTLNKILRAMYCEPVLLPRFRKTPQKALAERVKEVARRRVARAGGKKVGALLRSEEERLLSGPSSDIWDEAPAVRIVDKKDEDDRDTLKYWLSQPVEARIAAVEFLRQQTYLVTGHKTLPRIERKVQIRDLHA